MINKELIKILINERVKLHPDDPRVEEYWCKLTNELSQNEGETIEFLDECSEYEINWLSEIFEDISEKFQSIKFINFLRSLQKKYPSIDLRKDIEYAEKQIKAD